MRFKWIMFGGYMLTKKIKLIFTFFRMVMLKKFKMCATRTRSRRSACVVVGVVVLFVLSVHLLLNRHYRISEYCYNLVVLTYHYLYTHRVSFTCYMYCKRLQTANTTTIQGSTFTAIANTNSFWSKKTDCTGHYQENVDI